MENLRDKSILITGGTGSFGKAFVRRLLDLPHPPKRIVVFSRDELKQYEMSNMFTQNERECLRFFLGDIRDKERLVRAFDGIDFVIHAAALKQVPAAEYNPFECIKTNILGAQNLIEACLDTEVTKVVALSTDKAAAPINLYGATKLCSDKLFISGRNMVGGRDLCFSVVRYGNVMGSRGSVIPFFKSRVHTGSLPITDPQMTRFNISLEDGVNMVLWVLENAFGGEIFIPKIPSYNICDIAKAIGPNCDYPVVGIRPGEKLHEEMITRDDAPNTLDIGEYYAILPSDDIDVREKYLKQPGVTPVEADFSYNSGENTEFLSIDELKDLIEKFA